MIYFYIILFIASIIGLVFTILNLKNIKSSVLAPPLFLLIMTFIISTLMFPLTFYRLVTNKYDMGDINDQK